MNYVNDIQELIGNTPLLKLNHSSLPDTVNVYAKLEYLNPAGSIKDRIGMAMIESAEKQGLLKKGGTVIEATAGNTGIGIALASIHKGYRVICIMPEFCSTEKAILIEALGGEVIRVSNESGMPGARRLAEDMQSQISGSVVMNQFNNPANPRIHYETTGPELYQALDGNIDYFVMGAGTGGTFSGICRFLKDKNPEIKGVLADPVGSVIGGGEPGSFEIEGIGNHFIADTMDMSLVDQVIKVSDDEAFTAVKCLAEQEGLLVGSSSGAAFAAVKKLIKTGVTGTIVTVFPDRSDRYLSEGIYGE
ncbi:MAG: cysteine synthase family protein [Erysipelotrichaceae bacterium]|nr:cysteine synthase family protein [Erysipelotrichaceae bacterium]